MTTTILVTGAGGAAAVSFVKAVRGLSCRIIAADMDPHAAGLYLVPENQRTLIPRADSPDFVPALLDLCARHHVDVLVPTVDAELLPIALERDRFDRLGTRVMSASADVLRVVLDKYSLAQVLDGIIPVPHTELLDEDAIANWNGPAAVKPRRGAGSRDISILDSLPPGLPANHAMIVQEFLPGTEYSVDVLADRYGNVHAAVPRERMKVDSGIAVASRTVRDPELEQYARIAVETLGLPYISNVQFRRNRFGVPCLLEINPRLPGTMPLTVASGVNMPRLALRALFGHLDAADVPAFREVATVRYWTERFFDPSEMMDYSTTLSKSA